MVEKFIAGLRDKARAVLLGVRWPRPRQVSTLSGVLLGTLEEEGHVESTVPSWTCLVA